MNRVNLLYRADKVARMLRRVGLSKVTRAGRSLLGRRLARALTVEVDGFRISGDIRHRGHLYSIGEGAYEQLTRALFRNSVGPGMVVLDIGAHLGLYTLIAASRTGANGAVYAFEPDPRTFPHLVQNIEVNGLTEHVTAVRKAVSELAGEEYLFLDSNLAVSGLVPVTDSDAAVTTSCITVDEFVPAHQRVDVVKMDIEGGELRALRGMSRTIARAGESLTMFVEVHPGPLQAVGSSGEAVVAELERMGLRAQVVDEGRGVLRSLAAGDLRGNRGVHLRCTRG